MQTTDPLDNQLPEITAWRRHLHQHPETGYEVHATAEFVAAKLRAFGADEVVEGIGLTGVVGVIHGRERNSGKVVGLRADMDALLGAAQALCDTRSFDGTVVVVFQPAEEVGAGALAMINDRLMERFDIQEVYGLHNMPDLPLGEFAIRAGPLMACADEFDIVIQGYGGHAAMPQLCTDSVVVASHVVLALQTIVSRGVKPTDPLVISVTTMEVEGGAYNVIPQSVRMRGTLRAFDEQIRQQAKQRVIDIAQSTAKVFNANADVDYRDGYPATVNHDAQTEFVVDVVRQMAGDNKVDTDATPTMGAEDFAYMLQARPGAFVFMGNGSTAGLHHPQYDFNDEAIRYGCRYWINLAHAALPLPG